VLSGAGWYTPRCNVLATTAESARTARQAGGVKRAVEAEGAASKRQQRWAVRFGYGTGYAQPRRWAREQHLLGPPVSGAIIELDLGCTGLQRATAAGGARRVVKRLEREVRCVNPT
jgi:hypothetical protein